MEEAKKPLPMKLFSTWEGERTAGHCIPRTCTFKLHKFKLTKQLEADLGNLIICASISIGNFRRSLRTDEIFLDKDGNAELDYSFSFQYPHYLKREENILKLSLQRRKRYGTRTMPGFKTVAIGQIDLAQIMQYPTDEKLKMYHKGGGFQVALLILNQVASLPHESIRNHSGENSSSEDDYIFHTDDDLDSEGEERGTKKKGKMPVKDSGKLKKKFTKFTARDLLRKIKLADEGVREGDEELGGAGLPHSDRSRYSGTFSSFMEEGGLPSEEGSDSDSVGTLPKPHLAPYFESEKGSSTGDEAVVMGRPGVRTSVSQSSTPVIGDLRHHSPVRQSPTSQESGGSFEGSEVVPECRNLSERLDAMFSKESVVQVPNSITLAHAKEKSVQHSVIRALRAHGNCLYLQTGGDAKLFITTLVNKMQKCVTRHSRMSPVTLIVVGDFSSCSLILKPLMDSLNNKSADWVNNIQFIFIPTDVDNPIGRYISGLDDNYSRLLESLSGDTLDLIASYEREAREPIRLSVGRVLLQQTNEESEDGTKQVEVPFLHSVCFLFRTKCCVTCLEAEQTQSEAAPSGHPGAGEGKCREHETDIQVDYTSLSKRDASGKPIQVKGLFRELSVSAELGTQSITLRAAYRERKPKGLPRLKKAQHEILTIHSKVSSFTCMLRSLNNGLTCSVKVDGVEQKNVHSLYISPLWAQNLNHIPILKTPGSAPSLPPVSSAISGSVLC